MFEIINKKSLHVRDNERGIVVYPSRIGFYLTIILLNKKKRADFYYADLTGQKYHARLASRKWRLIELKNSPESGEAITKEEKQMLKGYLEEAFESMGYKIMIDFREESWA